MWSPRALSAPTNSLNMHNFCEHAPHIDISLGIQVLNLEESQEKESLSRCWLKIRLMSTPDSDACPSPGVATSAK